MSDGGQIGIEELHSAAKAAAQAKNWALALEHCDAALEAFPNHRRVRALTVTRASALTNLARYAEAEIIFRSLDEEMSDKPQGLAGLARVAQAEGDWSLALERWDTCIQKFPLDEDMPNWRKARARMLEKLGAWQDAFESWDALAKELAPDREALVARVRCFLELVGPTAEAEQLVVTALESFPRDASALRMYADLAVQQDDSTMALGRWMDYVTVRPADNVYGYRMAMLYAIQCGDRPAAATIIELAPPELSATTSFRSRVLLPFYDFENDIDTGLKLLRDLQSEELDGHDAVAISNFLLKIQRHKEAFDLLETRLDRVQDHPQLFKNYLQAAHFARGPEFFEAEKARLHAGVGDAVAAQYLTLLPKSWLTPSELMVVIDHQFSSVNATSRMMILALHIADTNDRNVMQLLSERLDGHEGPYVRVVQRILKSKIRDSQRIACANMAIDSCEEFRTESLSLAADLDELVAKLIGTTESSGPSGEASFPKAASALRRIRSRAGAAWLNSSASYYDAASFAAWIADRIARRKPTSAIRLGDGEGNFLPYATSFTKFQSADRSEIQQQMWGEKFFSASAAQRFTDELASVAIRADAVGLTTINRLLKVHYIDRRSQLLSTVVPARDARGWHNVLHFFDGIAPEILSNKIVVSNNFHSDLNSWDLYRKIFQSISTVSTVSCHDLSAPLAHEFGLSLRCWHRIPAQKKHLGMFSHESGQIGERFYPDIFNRIMAEVAPEPGEVFLVAAGLLGKFICDRVRAQGGIALDIGSFADYWMGYTTREYGSSQLTLAASNS